MLTRFSLPGFKNAMENKKCLHRSRHHYHEYHFQSYYNRHRHHYHCCCHCRRHHHHHHHRRHRHYYRHYHHHHHHHHNHYYSFQKDHYNNQYRHFCSSNCSLIIDKNEIYDERFQQYLRIFLKTMQGILIFVNLRMKQFLSSLNASSCAIRFSI